MKKYIIAGICLIYSFFRFCFIKLFHMKDFKFSFINIISPFTEIEINKKSKFIIGKMVRIRSGSKIKIRRKAEVQIGDNTFFNHGCIVVCHDKIIIGKDVQLGPNVLIYDHDHDFRAKNGLKKLKYKTSPVIIGNNVWIGANTVILRGTKIGDNCVIGAGSVVSQNIPSESILIQKRENIINNYKYY
ncbi:acyltransferase [Clostridium perfringens]|uniref:acyltransferase n=1 Tax=Clostridium perfringens TaxID=1502 RepID=UPI0006C19AC3|nr:acyltransferase [Clostridium perfringens]EHK2335417.1 acyltransferase [Clostridium perfringens]MBI6054809.1 acyltransferase [Clostridium perfringens]MBO3325693.1 acyltransferase [Clostridium perfringens]TBX07413.1 hypothetical protein BFS07_09705 [Clostridium perfringens]CUO81375.1 maltose O-acetyltransferase [Clostridium perfringens]